MDNIEVLALVLNCKIGALPTSYLGLPLGATNKDLTAWNPVIERVERDSDWQKRDLSKGGKEGLITLSSIPTYFMSLLYAPISVTTYRGVGKISE